MEGRCAVTLESQVSFLCAFIKTGLDNPLRVRLLTVKMRNADIHIHLQVIIMRL